MLAFELSPPARSPTTRQWLAILRCVALFRGGDYHRLQVNKLAEHGVRAIHLGYGGGRAGSFQGLSSIKRARQGYYCYIPDPQGREHIACEVHCTCGLPWPTTLVGRGEGLLRTFHFNLIMRSSVKRPSGKVSGRTPTLNAWNRQQREMTHLSTFTKVSQRRAVFKNRSEATMWMSQMNTRLTQHKSKRQVKVYMIYHR